MEQPKKSKGIFEVVLFVFSCFLGLWPRTWVRALGIPLAILWFDILRIRRQVVLDNLLLAFPDWELSKRISVGRKAMITLTSNFFEVMLIPVMHKKFFGFSVLFEGEENLIEALKLNRGVYVLSLHMGNGDVGANALSLRGYKVNLITKFFRNKFFNNLWFYFRRGQGVKLIEPHGSKTPFDILKATKKNELVVFVNDQFMGKPYGVETKFFGVSTGTAFGLGVFYMKTKSPIVPIYALEGDDGRVHVKILKPLDCHEFETTASDNKLESQVAYEKLAQKINDQIESIVRAHPSQWMWVHRRWKTFE